MRSNNALKRTGVYSGRPVLAKGWRARRGGMWMGPAAEQDRIVRAQRVAADLGDNPPNGRISAAN
jgi:hypothetical protein